MKTSPPPPAPPHLPEFARELTGRIERVRAWRNTAISATAAAMVLAVVLAWLAGECALDFLLALPWWARALCLLGGVTGASLPAWRYRARLRRQQPGDEAVALMIERALPAFRSRFIASVQLARGASTPLVRALVAETTALARTRHFITVIDTRALRRAMAAAAVAALTGLALWFACGENSAPLLRRAVLSTEPAPRRTKLHMLSGNRTISFGDDFPVEAGVSGVVPSVGRLHVKSASGRELDLPIEADPTRRTRFAHTLTSVPEPFDYFVTLGDARSETFHVQLQPRPTIVSVEATQTFPAYTKLPPRRLAPGDLQLLAGSHVALHVKADVPVQSGAIRLVAGERTLAESPLAPNANDATQLAGEIAISAKDATGFTLRLIGADGLESRANTLYRIDLLPDQPPAVKIHQPDRRQELLTPGGTMRLAFEAKDDFGLAGIRLHYAVDWTAGAPSQVVDLGIGSDLPREISRHYDWQIARLQPAMSEGQILDYWIEAFDANEPANAGVTEHYQVRVVSEFEKRADLAHRLGETVKSLDQVRQGEADLQAKLDGVLASQPASPIAPETLGESEAGQQQLAGEAQKLTGKFEAALSDYERNKLTGADVDVVKKMRDSLARLATGGMQTVAELLQKARQAGDPAAARKAAMDAHTGQKQIVEQITQLIAEHGRQQEGLELSGALAQIADRQSANLQKGIESGRQVSAKKAGSLITTLQESFTEQAGEQAALATDLKSLLEKITRYAKELGHAEMSQRFQPVTAEAPRVQAVAEAAAAMLKDGQIFKAAAGEKSVRDALRRLARQTAPPQSPAEAAHLAEGELGKMMAQETAIASEAQQAGVQDFDSWLDRQAAGGNADKKFQRPRNELRADKALREEFEQAKRESMENLAALENRQGDLAAKCDLLAQDLAAQAPNAVPAIRAAFEKMQDVRATLLDKAVADAAQHAQAALANLAKARTEVAQAALRAAAPPRQQTAANVSSAAQQPAAAQKQAGDLAKIIEAGQKLALDIAKIVAQAPSNPGAALKGLDVRQADLRAQTGDVKAALAGDPPAAVEALNDAGREMSAAQSQLEKSDGPAADAAGRKSLADLYRALRALNQKIAEAGEPSGGNETNEANTTEQTATQLTQAQAALAESQDAFQKVEAAQQAGLANVKAMQQAAATLVQAAQQAGKAAAETHTTNEAALRAMQDGAQDAADAAAQAAAGHAPAAQARAAAAQAKLALAAFAFAQAQAGLAAIDIPITPGSEPAVPSGTHAAADSRPDFSGLPARDRAVIEQAQPEKYPAQYGPLVEQYLRNIARESARK